jgi:very-short-patch-repair endonuclease
MGRYLAQIDHTPRLVERFRTAIARLAASQWGYVTRWQLLHLGLSPRAIRYGIETGWLIRAHAGVYAVAGHENRIPVARAMAAVLACGDGALLSHGSGGALWGFFKHWDTPFEITVGASRRCRRPGIKVHRSRTLTPPDIDCQLGVPVTSPARTMLDIAPRLTDRRLTRVVNDARHGPHLHLDDLADALARNPTHPGTRWLIRFVENPAGATRSGLEDEFVAFAKRYRLPKPEINTLLHGYEVDVLFVEERVIVEIDGYPFHSDRASFERDRDRDAHFLAYDHLTVRVTEERFKHTPEREARRLHAILRGRRRG